MDLTLVQVVVCQARDTRAHAIASQRAQLLERMQFLTSLILGIVVVILISELVIFQVLIQQIWLLHDSVTHRNVGVSKRHMEHMGARLPEIDRLLKGLDQRELFPLKQLSLHFIREPLAAIIDELFGLQVFRHAWLFCSGVVLTKFLQRELPHLV